MFNTQRPADAPASLASKQKYDGADVYESLREIFFDKCYICETKEPHDINVEHFEAHEKDLDKKFDWSNLYLACSRCNNIKRAEFNEILDCCDDKVDVFRAIRHVPPNTPYAKTVRLEAIAADDKTINTCKLLDKVFNSDHTVNKKVSGAFLRKKVYEQYNLLYDQVNKYYSPIATLRDKEDAIERIKVLMLRSAPYSAFIRWCVLDDEGLGELLGADMD
ncbi:HNH endonuclease [Pseudomonas shirazensis]|uniref:HNH endonuclease n=1 Tax=Pseudomonas shirazensis TaxID=2745494 RepID=A0ABU8ZX83_9PSED